VKPFQHWSATQVTTFRLCQRKWYLNKIVGMEQPVTQALLDGKQYAEEAERFFLTGETDGLSSVTRPLIALAASGKIPGPRTRPGSLLHVEHPIGVDRRAINASGVALLAVDGLPAEGYMDLLDLRAGYPVVWDQKTTKDRKWIKEPDQLRTDVQMTLYAAATVLRHQTVYGCAPEAVGVAHIALIKPPKAAEGVVVGPVYLDLEHIETQWQGIQATVREMAQVALAAAPDRVTPTWSACTAFGGCAFLDTCKAMKTLTTSTEGSTTMSLLSTLAAKRAAALASPTTPTAAPVAVRPGLAASIAAQLAKPGQITPADAPASPSLAGIAAALKPGAVRPVIAAVPTPVVFPLIAEFPPVVFGGAVVELAPVAVVAEVATSKRQPRNGTPRLVALGWSEVEIARMSCERKHEILDGGLKPPPVVVVEEVTDRDQPAAPTEFVDWDLNSEVSLNEALRLGWDYTQLLVVSDEIFGRILCEGLRADEWVLDNDGYDVTRRKPPAPTQAEVKATFVELEQVLFEPGPGDRPVEVVEVAPPVVVAAPVLGAVLAAALAERVVVPDLDAAKAFVDRIMNADPDCDVHVVEVAAPVAPPTLTLLIGCRPSKGMEYRELGDVLEPAMRGIEELKRITYWDLLPYNEGGKLLAASCLMNPPTGVVVVDPAAPYANAVLAVLLPMASVVVRA
jgi:hypothetical protein